MLYFGRVGSSWGHCAFFGSSWGKNVITPKNYNKHNVSFTTISLNNYH
jgi:hypothetical protein